MHGKLLKALGVIFLAGGQFACSDDDAPAGNGGAAGAAGSSGAAGAAGSSGSAGAAGTGGAPSCVGTEPTDPAFAVAMDAFRAELAKDDVPGGAVAVIKDGQILHVGVAGSKKHDVCDPIDEDTLFRTGLITFLLTTAAVLDAAEDGKLDLDQPVSSTVSSFSGLSYPTNEIKLRHLLTQSSGISADQVSGCGTLSDAFAAPVQLWADAGRISSWTVANLQLAGLALEIAGGNGSYDQAARARILDPLGMDGTFDPQVAAQGNFSWAHQRQAGNVVQQDITAIDCASRHPSDQYHGSIGDVSKLVAMVIGGGGDVLDAASVAQILSAQGPSFWGHSYSSLGLDGQAHAAGTANEEHVLWVSGSSAGFAQEIVFYPKRGLAFVALLNGAWPVVSYANDAVARIIEPTLPPLDLAFTPDPATWSGLAGTYVDDLGTGVASQRELTIEYENQKLWATLVVDGTPTATKTELTPYRAQDNFSVKLDQTGQEAIVRFWRDANGVGEIVSFFHGYGPPAFRQTL